MKNVKKLIFLIVFVLSGCLVSLPQKQYSSSVSFQKESCEIFVSGNIDNSITASFQQLIQTNKFIKECKDVTVVLSSLGGNFYPATTLGNIIRNNRFNTKVKENEICGSACVLVYISGSNRFMSNSFNTKIGLHQAISIESGKERCIDINEDINLSNSYRSYLKKMISDRAQEFYLYTIQSVSCKSVKFFNANELKKYEIVTTVY
jgi:hypothetical protein